MSMLNRRNALTAVATLPALAVPAAVALAGSPDAELIRLGGQLDQVIREYNAQQKIDRQRSAEFDVRMEALTGDSRENWPDPDWENPIWIAHMKDMDAVWKAMAPHQAKSSDDEPWTEIHGRLFPLAENILSRRAQTIAGLAVQTRAVVMAAAEMWDGDNCDDEHARSFIEAVCSFAGVSHKELLG